MPIDTQREHVISLQELPRTVSSMTGGKKVHFSTGYRWCMSGVNGVRLEYIKVGRQTHTSCEALNRFFQRLAEADQESDGAAAPPASQANSRTTAHRRADFDRAEQELEAGGVR